MRVPEMPLWLQSIFLRSTFLQSLLFRVVCPGDGSKWVRDCVKSGECGCDNLKQ